MAKPKMRQYCILSDGTKERLYCASNLALKDVESVEPCFLLPSSHHRTVAIAQACTVFGFLLPRAKYG